MKRYLLLAAICCLFSVTVFCQPRLVEKVVKKGSELVIPYEKYVLPNGLTVIVHEDHSDPIAHIDVTYHVGSAREEIGKSGFAHFFEHMLFQGSDHVGDDEHFKLIQDMGGTLNGSTDRDRTNYYQTVPVNQLEKVLWLEADRMGFFLDAVTQRKFEIQRSTVKNERGQNYDNVPYGLRTEITARNLYPYGHPYSWLTIGYVEDLNRVDVNDLKNFFLRWYGPNNATITVGGDVKTAEVLKMVEKYFGSIQRGPEVKPVVVPPVKMDGNRYVSHLDNYARLPMLSIVYPTQSEFHKDRAPLACLAQVLGQGRNSVFFQQLIKKQTVVQANAFNTLSELAGEFHVILIPGAGKTLKDLEDGYKAALDSFEARGVTDDDVAKFKGGYESQLINGLQSVAGKVTQIARFEFLTGNPNQINELLKMYSAVTKEDVMRVYNQYIKNKPAVILSIVPKGQEAQIVHKDNYTVDTTSYVRPNYGYEGLKYVKGKDNFDRRKMPAGAPPPTITVPKIWRKDLANGAKVVGTENAEIPTVTLTITIPGGHLLQANDFSKVGLATYFANMMNEDTKNYTAESMAVELQKLGSSINVNSSLDGIVFTVQMLKKNMDPVMALLKERMLNPKFTEASFNRLRSQKMQAFKLQKSQAGAVADEVFAMVNYGPDHILGKSQQGTEETVSRMTLQDIQHYHDNYMTSLDTKIVIVGDVKQQEILPKLDFLDQLPRKKIVLPKVDPAPAVNKTKVYMVDIPKSAQSEFRVGYATGLKYDVDGDYYKSQLANYPLSGNFNSRLNMNLREDKAWTYAAYGGFLGTAHSGEYQFSPGIRSDATDSALVEIMKEVRRYYSDGPSKDEVEYIKNSLSQSQARRYETGPQKALFIGRILDYNLPADYSAKQDRVLKKITREELHGVTKKYLNPDKLNILLVGDEAKILEGVKKLGYEIVHLDVNGAPAAGKKGF